MPLLHLDESPIPSFRYGGGEARDALNSWPAERSEDGQETIVVHRDPATHLKVTTRIRRFEGSPAYDWVVELENEGAEPTPILDDILPLDIEVPMPLSERFRIHHALGSSCRMDDFLPQTTQLHPRSDLTLAPVGGRSSSGVWPFMNLQRAGSGAVLAIGWTGQWAARFERGNDALRITAGMQRTRLYLRPGERIRTPRILIVPWEGDDPEQGANALRRLLMQHYLPRLEGELVKPPSAQCLQAYYYATGEAGESLEMTALPRVAALGLDAYWIDACWYGAGEQWWEQVGSWSVNPKRFPNGLRPISDAAHREGMKFVLWFEPERVRRDSQFHRDHPEFLLACDQDSQNLLVNLGLPEAREYLTGLISACIAEHGVDIYRQDFNIDALPYWQAADDPDRIGMTEIAHVEGLYRFWDDLRERHPSLWIDNCASGGRRIDLETMSRSLPLWPSDFPDIVGIPYGLDLHVGTQCINAGLARWIPLFGGGVWNFTPYSTRSQIIGGFSFGYHIEQSDFPADDSPFMRGHKEVLPQGHTLCSGEFPMEAARAAVEEWRSIRQFVLGDFHLLVPLTASSADWCAWQFHRDDMQAGIAMFFRRHRSPFPSMSAALRRIDPDAGYEVSLTEGYAEGPRQTLSGRELTALSISIDDAPGSILLRYRRLA